MLRHLSVICLLLMILTPKVRYHKRSLESILAVNKEEWLKEVESIKEHYKNYGPKLPQELNNQLAALEQRLKG